MQPVKTSFWQKLLLIGLGVVLTLAIIEVFLRIAGSIVQVQQSTFSRATFAGDEIRILCIGESTTQSGNEMSYPQQLEALLRQTYPEKKITVINRGETAKTSHILLSHLNENLQRFKPHIVVGMIGINDGSDTPGFAPRGRLDAVLNKFRVYRLFLLVIKHVKRTVAEYRLKRSVGGSFAKAQLPSIEDLHSMESINDEDLPVVTEKLVNTQKALGEIKLRLQDTQLNDEQREQVEVYGYLLTQQQALYYRLIGMFFLTHEDYSNSQYFLGTALELAPDDPDNLVQVGRLFRIQSRTQSAASLFLKAAELAPANPSVLIELARTYSEWGRIDEARNMFLRAADLHPRGDDSFLNLEIGVWLDQHNFLDDAQRVLTEAYFAQKSNYQVLYELSSVCRKLGQKDKADLYYEEAEFLRRKTMDFSIETMRNYNEIVRRVKASGARMIVMQYPMRSIEAVRKILLDKDGIIFVENRENFLAALKYGDFANYFADSFAGDFGHCTPAGNRLIAQNLFKVISEHLFFKK